MGHARREPRRGEGRPRMTLDEAERQWRGPRRRHIEKHKAEYLRAFHRYLYEAWPHSLQTRLENYGLCAGALTELECLGRPPFRRGHWPVPVAHPTREAPGELPRMGGRVPEGGSPADSAPDQGAAWRREMIEDGLVVPVEHDGVLLHFGEHLQHMMEVAFDAHLRGWRQHWDRPGAGEEPPYLVEMGMPQDELDLLAAMGARATGLAADYVSRNPGARIVGAPEPEPGMYDGWPPAQPDGQPPMDDGSHLLASERGRRRIDPATGARMIRTMVLTEGAWPHWEWSEDVEGAGGVGPWGPGVSIGTPDEPAQMSPRESMRPHLARIGRLDLLEKYLPWPGDPPL